MRPPSTNSCVMMWPYLTPESSVCTWKTLPLWRTLLLYPKRGDVGLGDMESASASAQAKQCTTSGRLTNSWAGYADLPWGQGGQGEQPPSPPREMKRGSGEHDPAWRPVLK